MATRDQHGGAVRRRSAEKRNDATRISLGDRVHWQDDAKDRGKVVDRDWSGVKIEWESGKTTYYHHNDMRDVMRSPQVV